MGLDYLPYGKSVDSIASSKETSCQAVRRQKIYPYGTCSQKWQRSSRDSVKSYIGPGDRDEVDHVKAEDRLFRPNNWG